MYLGITRTHFFISRKSKITEEGIIDKMYPLADVRYVRFQSWSIRDRFSMEGFPKLEIFTEKNNIDLRFDWLRSSWLTSFLRETSDPELAGVQRIGDLFATAMNIPKEEYRDDPLFAEAHQALEAAKTGMKELPRKSRHSAG